MKYFFILLSVVGVNSDHAWAGEPVATGRVVSVVDGNTLEVMLSDKETIRVYLFGIDCPELTQEYGTMAKKCLERILMDQEVNVEFRGKDRKGNHIAIVTTTLDDDPRIDLLREGLAWALENDSSAEFDSYIRFAKQKKKGLWKAENPTPPWVYRRQQSMMEPKKS